MAHICLLVGEVLVQVNTLAVGEYEAVAGKSGTNIIIIISLVSDEIRLAFRTLLIHVAEIAGVSDVIVLAFAFSSGYWITSVPATITP